MASYKVERRVINRRGCVFNFMTYEATSPNERKGEPRKPESWYLVVSPRRWEVIPHDSELAPEQLDELLIAWLDEHVFA